MTQSTMKLDDTHFCTQLFSASSGDTTQGCDSRSNLLKTTMPVVSIKTMWPNGSSLTVHLRGNNNFIKSKVMKYAAAWVAIANIAFVFTDQEQADIRVSFEPGRSWSYIGIQSRSVANDKPTMNFGWFTEDTSDEEFSHTVIHEFGHALGCVHEHGSPVANIWWNKPAAYEYYKLNYDTSGEEVDHNLFKVYDFETTRHTNFDVHSIMLYPIPPALTMDRFSSKRNEILSTGDREFIRKMYPGRDLGATFFDTTEVRSPNEPAKEAAKQVTFKDRYATQPTLALGLTNIHAGKGSHLRVKCRATSITGTGFVAKVNTWGDSVLYGGGCAWVIVPVPNSLGLQQGAFSTIEDHPWGNHKLQTTSNITFPQAFPSPPKVVVWLTALQTDQAKGCRVATYVSGVTSTGFTIHVDTWRDSLLYGANVCWLAHPADGAGVASGIVDTESIRPWHLPRLDTSGNETFQQVLTGSRPPRVMAALSYISLGSAPELRVALEVTSIKSNGFVWNLKTWDKSILYRAKASYIAWV